MNKQSVLKKYGQWDCAVCCDTGYFLELPRPTITQTESGSSVSFDTTLMAKWKPCFNCDRGKIRRMQKDCQN